jgi:hypothetical protein
VTITDGSESNDDSLLITQTGEENVDSQPIQENNSNSAESPFLLPLPNDSLITVTEAETLVYSITGYENTKVILMCVGLEIQNDNLYYTIKAYFDSEIKQTVIGWYAVDIYGYQIYDTMPLWELIYEDSSKTNKLRINPEISMEMLSMWDANHLVYDLYEVNSTICLFVGLEFHDESLFYLIDALNMSDRVVTMRYAVEVFGDSFYKGTPDWEFDWELILEN